MGRVRFILIGAVLGVAWAGRAPRPGRVDTTHAQAGNETQRASPIARRRCHARPDKLIVTAPPTGDRSNISSSDLPQSFPVLPIGAEVLPPGSHSRVARSAIEDATAGSALDCDLGRREDARHGGRARPGLCRGGHWHSVTASTADLRVRACWPGGGGAPVRASAREGATWPPPRGRTAGPPSPP